MILQNDLMTGRTYSVEVFPGEFKKLEWCGSCFRDKANNPFHYDDCLDTQSVPVNVNDNVAHPFHYTSHPSGVECIQVTEHMGFCLGNAIKYIWRADLKDNKIEDLKKAAFYINREIERLENA